MRLGTECGDVLDLHSYPSYGKDPHVLTVPVPACKMQSAHTHARVIGLGLFPWYCSHTVAVSHGLTYFVCTGVYRRLVAGMLPTTCCVMRGPASYGTPWPPARLPTLSSFVLGWANPGPYPCFLCVPLAQPCALPHSKVHPARSEVTAATYNRPWRLIGAVCFVFVGRVCGGGLVGLAAELAPAAWGLAVVDTVGRAAPSVRTRWRDGRLLGVPGAVGMDTSWCGRVVNAHAWGACGAPTVVVVPLRLCMCHARTHARTHARGTP